MATAEDVLDELTVGDFVFLSERDSGHYRAMNVISQVTHADYEAVLAHQVRTLEARGFPTAYLCRPPGDAATLAWMEDGGYLLRKITPGQAEQAASADRYDAVGSDQSCTLECEHEHNCDCYPDE